MYGNRTSLEQRYIFFHELTGLLYQVLFYPDAKLCKDTGMIYTGQTLYSHSSPSPILRHAFGVVLPDLPHRHPREHARRLASFEPYLDISVYGPLQLAILAPVGHRCREEIAVEDDVG